MSESDWFFLDDDEFKAIMRLVREYHRQAVRCEDAKAYLAGCVMVGAALEAALLAMVHLNGPVVETARLMPKVKGAPKRVLKWSLAELVHAARGMGWLPAGLKLEDRWNGRRAKIGDYAEVLRQLRNLIHPARHLEHSRSRITKKYLSGALVILDVARKHLGAAVAASIKRTLGFR